MHGAARATFDGPMPEGLVTYGGTPLQLEENEDDTSTLSAVQLFADGSVTLNDTDGPIATSVCGRGTPAATTSR